MKKIFVCSAYRGNIRKNVKKARQYCREIVLNGDAPFAPHLLYPQFLDDRDLDERQAGMRIGAKFLLDCDAVYVYGAATEGMAAEIKFAVYHGKEIIYK